MLPKHRAPFQGERGGRGEGRGFRGRDNRGRSRGEGRPYTGGRGDRGEGMPEVPIIGILLSLINIH